jgi:hypothetical protein
MAMVMDELPRQGVEDLDRGALFRGWLHLNGGMAFDPASQVFRKDDGPATALSSDQCAIADGLINCGSTGPGDRACLGYAVNKWNIHLKFSLSLAGVVPATALALLRAMAIRIAKFEYPFMPQILQIPQMRFQKFQVCAILR